MKISNLFSELTIKDVTFKNRVVMSPMCQYKAINGFVDDWHYQHYSRFAFSGLGGAFIEATGVAPEGRITHGCTGIWDDNQIEGLKKITKIFKDYDCVCGIQLAHAGRKASFLRPWDGAKPIEEDTGNEKKWQIIGPSSIAVNDQSPTPLVMTQEDIDRVKVQFKEAAIRSLEAGFDMVEIHGAHGYLLHSFFSPISNKRNDKYGGSLDNRMRLGLEIVNLIKKVWPENRPVFFRLSSVDGADNGSTLEENIIYAQKLNESGVDVIDCSSGGIGGSPILNKSRIIPGFQVPYSEKIKKESGVKTMAVGAIIDPYQAEEIITKGRADLVAIGRELLADTQWVYKAASMFKLPNAKSFLPDSYSFYLQRRDQYLDRNANPS